MIRIIGAKELSIGSHDIGRKQAVDGKPVLADKVPDPSPKRQPSDPDCARVAEPRCEVVPPRAGTPYGTSSSPLSSTNYFH